MEQGASAAEAAATAAAAAAATTTSGGSHRDDERDERHCDGSACAGPQPRPALRGQDGTGEGRSVAQRRGGGRTRDGSRAVDRDVLAADLRGDEEERAGSQRARAEQA